MTKDTPPDTKTPLIGYMILEDYCEDMSDWSGVITGPQDPTGANLAWESPIKMIEYSAFEEMRDLACELARALMNIKHACQTDCFEHDKNDLGFGDSEMVIGATHVEIICDNALTKARAAGCVE